MTVYHQSILCQGVPGCQGGEPITSRDIPVMMARYGKYKRFTSGKLTTRVKGNSFVGLGSVEHVGTEIGFPGIGAERTPGVVAVSGVYGWAGWGKPHPVLPRQTHSCPVRAHSSARSK